MLIPDAGHQTISAPEPARSTEMKPKSGTPVELRSLLGRILSEARPKIQARSLKFVFDAPGALPWVWGNFEGLYRCFKGIIDNAMESTPKGSRLSVSVDSFEQDGHPARVEVRVEDLGSGLSRAIQEKPIKSPFKEERQGPDLALAASRNILKDHQGTLRVENEIGKRKAFTVILPLCL